MPKTHVFHEANVPQFLLIENGDIELTGEDIKVIENILSPPEMKSGTKKTPKIIEIPEIISNHDSKLSKSDKNVLIDVMARSFHNYPIFTYFFEEEEGRLNKLKTLFKTFMNYALSNGFVIWAENLDGVLLSLPSNKLPIDNLEMVKAGALNIPLKLGVNFIKKQESITRFQDGARERLTANEDRYVFLWMIAVSPDAQGKGVGKKLVNHLFSEFMENDELCYLETAQKNNVAIYERMGFKLIEEDSLKTRGNEIFNYSMTARKQVSKTTEKSLEIATIDECVEYYRENREMNEWFNSTIESICDEHDLDCSKDIEKAIKIGKKTTFKELHEFLKEDIEEISRGASLFRAFSIQDVPKDKRNDYLEDLKNNRVKFLGEHWTISLSTARFVGHEILFLDKPWFVIEAKMDPSCINFLHSFCMRDAYPEENELVVNDDCGMEIIAIHENKARESR